MVRESPAVPPLKPLVFQILLVLADGEQHGWVLVRDLQERTGVRILPGNLYRTLRAMRAAGLIDEVDTPPAARVSALPDTGANADRRRYFRLTPLGRDAARVEARRLESLVAESRAKRILRAWR
jgi:DNA-binding PadR family transcriptional regulator